MDRRRYVPSAEGLEGRALLANSLFGSHTSASAAVAQDVPETFQLKEHRVERLPHFLELIRSGRILPTETVRQIQTDMMDVAAQLHAPGSPVLDGFNARLRKVEPSGSLSIADAESLNRTFGVVLRAAGATPPQVEKLQNDMNALAKVDANSRQSVFLATNDYTLVLETILAIGRPIRRPAVPVLAAHNGTRVGTNAGITPKSQPTLVGNYDPFAQIQIVDANLRVFGSSFVHKNGPSQSNGVAQANGRYTVTFDQPLADGLYTFYVRAIDPTGHASHLSPPFKLKVIAPHLDAAGAHATVPGGPLALKK